MGAHWAFFLLPMNASGLGPFLLQSTRRAVGTTQARWAPLEAFWCRGGQWAFPSSDGAHWTYRRKAFLLHDGGHWAPITASGHSSMNASALVPFLLPRNVVQCDFNTCEGISSFATSFTKYLRKFVRNYKRKCKPLYEMYKELREEIQTEEW